MGPLREFAALVTGTEPLLTRNSSPSWKVPVRVDYSDLYNLLAFFDGGVDEERTGNHDDLAEEIATAGAEWASQNWRLEDMQACRSPLSWLPAHATSVLILALVDVYRLLLEWARVMDPKREK